MKPTHDIARKPGFLNPDISLPLIDP
jgi:hypothetical protein